MVFHWTTLGGHISSYVLHQGLFKKTIAEAVERYREKYPGGTVQVEISPTSTIQSPSVETEKKVIEVLGFQNTKTVLSNDSTRRVWRAIYLTSNNSLLYWRIFFCKSAWKLALTKDTQLFSYKTWTESKLCKLNITLLIRLDQAEFRNEIQKYYEIVIYWRVIINLPNIKLRIGRCD